MSRLDDTSQQAIKALRKSGYLVSETGIVHITDDLKGVSSSITIYPWRKIKSFNRRLNLGSTIMMEIWGGDTGHIDVYITLSDKCDVPLVYKLLADRFIKYGG